MSSRLVRTAVALAAVALCAVAQATIPVVINPDGAGGDAPINVGSLDWSTGNSIAVADPGQNIGAGAVAGQLLTVYAHARLSGFQDEFGNGIGGLDLNSTYEWTFVSRFREQLVTVADPVTGLGTTSTIVVADPLNLFQIWYDPTPDAFNLTGKGFNDSLLILEARGGVGTGFFTADGTDVLDSFSTNNYSTYTSLTGGGSTTIVADVSFYDPLFFSGLVNATSIVLDFTSQQRLNYDETDPSSCFWNPVANAYFTGAGNGIAGGCGVLGDGGTIGLVNGVTGPNVMFQTDASAGFDYERVPEPGTLALAGVALFGLAAAARRRRLG